MTGSVTDGSSSSLPEKFSTELNPVGPVRLENLEFALETRFRGSGLSLMLFHASFHGRFLQCLFHFDY